MSYLKKTSEWIRKTQENIEQEQEYKKKLANNESTSMFNVVRRARTGVRLVPIHEITNYDGTLYEFIKESSAMCTKLTERVMELEDKIKELENK